MRALSYFLHEALASISRRWGPALAAVLTIAAALFVLGFVLVLQANLQRLVDRWSEAAELSVYLHEEVSDEQIEAIAALLDRSGLVEARHFVSKADALARFRSDFPELADTAVALERNPFPASVEARLAHPARDSAQAVSGLANALADMAGVADVQYDRRWLSRLDAAIRLVRGAGILVITVLAIGAALTVSSVVSLAVHARRNEIEIMELVGAPYAYIRGPFVLEGMLQGAAGALLALALLWGAFRAGQARYGELAAEGFGIGPLTFLPAELSAILLAGGVLLGSVGGALVARRLR